jgi:L-amino acid N-acyltransferase YncA
MAPIATLRHVDPKRDAAACAAIYAPYVDGIAISSKEVAPDATQFACRIATMTRTHPWLVLEDSGQVYAYAYASPHTSSRAAYRWAAEVATYVDSAHQRIGAGRQLFEALFDLLRRQNLRVALARITLPDDASIGFLRALGFEPVAIYRDIAWKNGAWHDVSSWQLPLARDDGPPAEVLGPQRLSQ